MRRFVHWFSPWHRGYKRGYQQALDNVAAGLTLTVDMASAYGQQTLDDAQRAIALTLMTYEEEGR